MAMEEQWQILLQWQVLFVVFVVGSLLLAILVLGVGTSTAPVDWPYAFGTSQYLTTQRLKSFRYALAVVFAFFLGGAFYRSTPGKFFWTVNNWNYTLEAIYFVVLAATSGNGDPSGAYEVLPGAKVPEPPFYVRFLTVLLSINLPGTLAVALVYWTLDSPVTDLCVFRREEPCARFPEFMELFLHGGDSILVFVAFKLGRVPFYVGNAGWFILVATAYFVFTLAHHLLGYAPIYSLLDWGDAPDPAVRFVLFVAFIVNPLLVLLVRVLATVRDFVDCMIPDSYTMMPAQETAMPSQ